MIGKNPYARRRPDTTTRNRICRGGKLLPARRNNSFWKAPAGVVLSSTSLPHLSGNHPRVSSPPFRGSVHYGVRVGAIPAGTSLLRAHARAGGENCAGQVHRHDRRRPGSDGSRQPRRERSPRRLHRLQHRASERAKAKPVSRQVGGVPVFLHPEDDAGEVLLWIRRRAGRIWHAGRIFRGRDADPDRQDQKLSRGFVGGPNTGRRCSPSCGNRFWRTRPSRRKIWRQFW